MNKYLLDQRKECRQAFNNAKRLDGDSAWEAYKSILNMYKTAIRKAKRLDWTRFCSEIESTSDASRLRKILSKTNTKIGALKMQDVKWTESSLETLELLLDTHFPTGTDFSERMDYN